jgi:ribosome-associated translation inhibitor RaiA
MAALLQISVRDMAPSITLESRIRRKLAGLERIVPRITSFRVTIGTDHHHLHGDRFSLKLNVRLPGMEIVVTRDHHEQIYVALREACQAARRQLLEHVARGQGADKSRRARSSNNARGEAAGNE